MAIPDTRYAKNGDTHIAYQTLGEGPANLVGIPPIVSNIEVIWEHPLPARFLRQIGTFSRFVHYDKRGQGMSDRDSGTPTLDERLEDLAAVMDAAGMDRAALAGVSEGGATAVLFAAMHPERVSHLILFGTTSRFSRDAQLYDAFFQMWADSWGTAETLTLNMVTPSMAGEPGFLGWLNRYERQSTSPGGLLEASRWIKEIDLASVLGHIQAPTLVIHRSGDRLVPVEDGRQLAEMIPGARLLELPGEDHMPWFGDQEAILGAMEEFLVGHHDATIDADRMLATVLFTDIVDSTRMAASMGDGRWHRLLDEHDEAVRRHLDLARGRLVKHTGDGILATFDGPVRAVRCAEELRRELSSLGLAIRAGIHTGEVEVRGEDIGGMAVHIGARVGALAGSGEVLVSRTVVDLVSGSGIDFAERGPHALKGVPGDWVLYAVA